MENNVMIQLDVINSTPAKVEFNKDAILVSLDEILKKYENIVLTEDTAKDVKKLKQELSKGRKAIDTFRKEQKKALSINIKPFEDDCKALCSRIDEVMIPLDDQVKEYEKKLKEEKQKLWDEYKAFAVEHYRLDEKRSAQLEPRGDALNLSTSKKKMKEGVMDDAVFLMSKQNAEAQKIELIKMHIENTNLRLGLAVEMQLEEFESMIDMELEDIKERVTKTGESRKHQEEEAVKQITENAKEEASVEAVGVIADALETVDKYIPTEIDGEEEFSWTLKLTTTTSKKDALKAYMTDMGIEFEVVK